MSQQLVQFVKQFENATLTTIVYKDKPWWVAREVGAAMRYSANGKRLVDNISNDWAADFTDADRWLVEGEDLRAIKEVIKNGNLGLGTESVPSLLLLSESGINKVILLSRKPEGRRLRDWLAKEVMPEIARTGKYEGAPALPAEPVEEDSLDLVIRQNQAIGAALARLKDQNRRLESVEAKIQRIEESRTEAAAEMTTVERSTEKPAELTQRMKVVRLHRAYCTAKGADFQETWRWLYRELRDRYHFDAKVRAENRKCSTLDVIEQEGLMGALFVLASDLLVVREVAAA